MEQSAYPPLWRDCLRRSLETPSPHSSSSSSAAVPPDLLVSVLQHISTGTLILVCCLTDRPHMTEFPSFMASTSIPSTMTTATIPYVRAPGGSSTTTVSVARGSILSTIPGKGGVGGSGSEEWCPPSFDSRPDLAALNAAGTLWALQNVWEEVGPSSDRPCFLKEWRSSAFNVWCSVCAKCLLWMGTRRFQKQGHLGGLLGLVGLGRPWASLLDVVVAVQDLTCITILFANQ